MKKDNRLLASSAF